MTELLWPLRDVLLSRLVARAQRGDREAFRDLYRELYPVVWRFARRRAGSDADAEEVLGQVFFQLVDALPRIDRTRGIRGYVLVMARNALIDSSRRNAHAAPESAADPVADETPGPLDRLVAAEDVKHLKNRLDALPAGTRELLLLRFGDGLRFPEIAQLVGLNEAAVRQRVSRAVRELRTQWHATVPKGRIAHEP